MEDTQIFGQLLPAGKTQLIMLFRLSILWELLILTFQMILEMLIIVLSTLMLILVIKQISTVSNQQLMLQEI